jgi:hypothetical protein
VTETLEERFKRKLNEAFQEADKVKRTRPSRENSLAITNLEQAMLWTDKDIEKKGQKAENRAAV